MRVKTLLLLLVLGFCSSASAQLVLESFTPEVIPYPVPANQFIVLQVGNLTATSIVFLDNDGLPTAKIDWQHLTALVPSFAAKHPGLYRLYVVDYLSPATPSNQIDLIVGRGARTAVCAGGILPYNTPEEEVFAYETKYDTTSCIYQEPPPGPLP